MDAVFEGLEPEIVWKYFDAIRKIPRCSKHEEKIREYVLSVAKDLGLEAKTDDVGNVLIIKPPSPGYENRPPVCIQAHMDMVCEKNADVEHDFSKDPIKVRRDGDYITAEGTTLGADNGIGVATVLALAESQDIKHPELQLLLTVDEETGMTGAFNLKEGFVTAKYLINIDSEEDGTIYIGCAGGGDTTLYIPMGRRLHSTLGAIKIKLHGLKGGHSGVDIHLGRANAIKSLARILWHIGMEQEIMLSDISGGDKRNAIPREATAVILLKDVDAARKIIDRITAELRDEYEGIEDNVLVDVSPVEVNEAYGYDETMRLLSLLYAFPHGYLAFNPHMKDLVDTSNNLASIKIENDEAVIGTSARSSIKSAMESTRDMLIALASLAGGRGEKGGSYPSWKPNMNSELLKIAREVYRKEFSRDPEVKAIHAGLETAVLGDKIPGVDMISIGPQIEFPHSPDERVHIPSVERFWRFLLAILREIS